MNSFLYESVVRARKVCFGPLINSDLDYMRRRKQWKRAIWWKWPGSLRAEEYEKHGLRASMHSINLTLSMRFRAWSLMGCTWWSLGVMRNESIRRKGSSRIFGYRISKMCNYLKWEIKKNIVLKYIHYRCIWKSTNKILWFYKIS